MDGTKHLAKTSNPCLDRAWMAIFDSGRIIWTAGFTSVLSFYEHTEWSSIAEQGDIGNSGGTKKGIAR